MDGLLAYNSSLQHSEAIYVVKIKPLESIASKWAAVTPGRAEYYAAGVRAPDKDWETNTAAADKAWFQGVTSANTTGLFPKGVHRAKTAKWQRKSIDVGIDRYPSGVVAAEEDMRAGFAPFHGVISRISLPPRGARGDPKNMARSTKMAKALHDARVGGAAAVKA